MNKNQKSFWVSMNTAFPVGISFSMFSLQKAPIELPSDLIPVVIFTIIFAGMSYLLIKRYPDQINRLFK